MNNNLIHISESQYKFLQLHGKLRLEKKLLEVGEKYNLQYGIRSPIVATCWLTHDYGVNAKASHLSTNDTHVLIGLIVCTVCGNPDITCRAVVNPNTCEISDFPDKSFYHGYCELCQQEVRIHDAAQVFAEMDKAYHYFNSQTGKEPQYAHCEITECDIDGRSLKVTIKLSCAKEDNIFYYCNGINDLKSLCTHGDNDFIITSCYSFS